MAGYRVEQLGGAPAAGLTAAGRQAVDEAINLAQGLPGEHKLLAKDLSGTVHAQRVWIEDYCEVWWTFYPSKRLPI